MGSIPVGISGSRAAAIIGLSKYATPFSVWQDLMETMQPGFNAKRGLTYEAFEGNAATDFGSAFEDPIIRLTEQKIDKPITDREGEYRNDNLDYITCHIDGLIGGKLFEGKSANNRVFGMDWGEPGSDKVPQSYQCQLQHNMMCSSTTEALMSVLVFPNTVNDWEDIGWKAHYDSINGDYFLKNHETDMIVDPHEWAKVFAQAGYFHQYHIKANRDAQKLLLEMYEDFWNKYVLTKTAPEVVNYEDVKRMFTAPKGTLVVADDIADQMREYKDIGKEIGTGGFLAKRRAWLKVQILKFASDKTTVADDDCQEKIVFRDEAGKKLGQFDGKTFRY